MTETGAGTPAPATVTPEFWRHFADVADPAGRMPFDRFMQLALYAPEIGYYRRPRQRVGYGAGTDFFTASTSGPVFGELVVAACINRLQGRDPSRMTFVECGAETAGGVLEGVAHPFAAVRVLQLGDAISIEGPCVVFSNELFDAQPFRRFRFRAGGWRELGVARVGAALAEVELEAVAANATPLPLPADAPDGYTVDAPIAATSLLEAMLAQPWSGLFVAFDYGKSWLELASHTPAGTARAYFRHTQTNDLLARPGEQDLTCHVCWDWLAAGLTRAGFADVQLDTQEAFFIRHAEAYLAPAIAADAGRLTRRKQSLLQLLHGSHLGQKFQVLHALR